MKKPRSPIQYSAPRLTGVAVVAVAAGLASTPALEAGRSSLPPFTGPQHGKALYRQYCGQCHSLTVALAAGFGSATNGLGSDGGPSFDRLRVPYNLSIVAVTTPFAGHEVTNQKMTWTEVKLVSRFIEIVTKRHPGLAQPIDG